MVAFKVVEFMSNISFKKYFMSEQNYEIFSIALTDINGNVCRQIINLLDLDYEFRQFLSVKLSQMLSRIWQEIEELDFECQAICCEQKEFSAVLVLGGFVWYC